MKIQTITYAELQNLGHYENRRIEATAIVQEDENPAEVLQAVKTWVKNQLAVRSDEQVPF